MLRAGLASRYHSPAKDPTSTGGSMLRHIAGMLLTAASLTSVALYAQHPTGKHVPVKMTTAQKITNAMSAAPAEISKHAAIMDWPEKPGGQPKELRAGTNGWACFPNSPAEFGAASIDDPMCLDKQWQTW